MPFVQDERITKIERRIQYYDKERRNLEVAILTAFRDGMLAGLLDTPNDAIPAYHGVLAKHCQDAWRYGRFRTIKHKWPLQIRLDVMEIIEREE